MQNWEKGVVKGSCDLLFKFLDPSILVSLEQLKLEISNLVGR